jgi:hypothetical protein
VHAGPTAGRSWALQRTLGCIAAEGHGYIAHSVHAEAEGALDYIAHSRAVGFRRKGCQYRGRRGCQYRGVEGVNIEGVEGVNIEGVEGVNIEGVEGVTIEGAFD